MGIFTDIKWIHLIKKVEGKYKSRFEDLTSSMRNLSGDHPAPANIVLLFKALLFSKKMNQFLFLSESGVFKNDIGKLNAHNYELLYQIELVWFSWIHIPENSDRRKNQQHLNFWIVFLENSLGIDPTIIKLCYDAYAYNQEASRDTRLVNCAFYKNCTLSIGHVDGFFEEMFENSPDYIKFIEIVNLAKEEADKLLN